MGIIFRNGIPYGATESDVTTVYEKADLYDLTDKREDHLYIVEEENKPYRYDLENDEFYPIGASDTPPITSGLNQIIVGDGNNWAKGNNLGYMITPTKAYDSVAGMPDEGTIGVYSPSFPLAFGELGAPSGSSGTTDYPYLKNGYVSRDNAVQKIQGKSKIVIGEENVDYSSQASNVYSFWSGTKNFSPSVVMSGTAQFQMLGGTTAYAKPVLSMLGNSVIEMNAYDWGSTYQSGYTRNQGYTSGDNFRLSKIAYDTYNGTDSPFGGMLNSSTPFPYIRMNNSSTIIMEGASLFRMADGAGVQIGGNAEVSIRGGGGSTLKNPQWKTGIDIEPGSTVRMARASSTVGGNFGPFFSMESGDSTLGSGKIVLTCQRNLNDNKCLFDYPSNDFDARKTLYGRLCTFTSRKYYKREFIAFGGIGGSYLSDWMSITNGSVFQPTLKIEGRTHISIGDRGFFTAKIGPEGDDNYQGYTSLDWTDKKKSYTDIKFGSGQQSYVTYDIGTDSNDRDSQYTYAYYKICPAAKSNTVFAYEPNGTSSLFFAPKGTSNIAYQPTGLSEISMQWNKLDALIEGDDAFIQTSGNFHQEIHGGTVIMRTTTPARSNIYYGEDPQYSHLNKDYTTFVAADSPTIQIYDKSNFAMGGESASDSYEYTCFYEFSSTTAINSFSAFQASDKYQDFADGLATLNRTFVSCTDYIQLTYSSPYKYRIIYKFTKAVSYLAAASSTHSPVFEMVGESELRLRDGASIRGTTVNNEIQFQFDDGTSSVSFTVAELTALKQLLSQPRLAQLTQQEYDQLDPPDPNTVYVIGEGE